MLGLLVLAAILAGLGGLLLLSNATMGVGVIGLGCLAGILARLRQADEQHRQLMAALGATAKKPGA